MAIAVDYHGYAVRYSCSTNPRDICGPVSCLGSYTNGLRLGNLARVADVDVIAASAKINASVFTDCGVIASGRVCSKREQTNGGVVAAAGVKFQRTSPGGRILVTNCVRVHGIDANCCIVVANSALWQHCRSKCRVPRAGSVTLKSAYSH